MKKPENCRPNQQEECDLQFNYENAPKPGQHGQAIRAWFCMTHQLWAYTFPKSVTYHYEGDDA